MMGWTIGGRVHRVSVRKIHPRIITALGGLTSELLWGLHLGLGLKPSYKWTLLVLHSSS
jgi:hypothetical protein